MQRGNFWWWSRQKLLHQEIAKPGLTRAVPPNNISQFFADNFSTIFYNISQFCYRQFLQYSTIFLNWPASRCLFLQTIFLNFFFPRCNVAAVLKSEVVHDEGLPKSYKSASSPATRPNPWPFDICHHHSTNTTTITPRLTFPFSSSHWFSFRSKW